MMGTKRICEFDTNTDSLRGVQNMMSTKLPDLLFVALLGLRCVQNMIDTKQKCVRIAPCMSLRGVQNMMSTKSQYFVIPCTEFERCVK